MTTQTTHTPIHIEHEGVLLRKVDRKYKNGDFVVFSKYISDATPGKPYEISNGSYIDDCGDCMSVLGWMKEPNPAIYEVVPQYKFKVGDKVIPSTLSAADRDYIGQTGVVTGEDSGYGGVEVEMSDGWTAIYKPKTLTLAVDAPSIKSGDRVKILAISKYGLDYVGKFGIVETVNFFGEEYTSVEPLDGGAIGLYLPEQLELAPTKIEPKIELKTEGETTLTNTFKVGDKVEMTSKTPQYGFGSVHTGDIGKVTGFDSDGEIFVDFPAQSEWSAEASDLTLVVGPTFKDGDKVVVLDAAAGRYQDQKNGAVGTISYYDLREGIETYRVDIDGDFDRFPASALELFVDEFEQFQPGVKVILVSGGNNHPLYGFHNGREYEVVNNDVPRSVGRLIEIKQTSGYNGFALPSQLKKVEAKVEEIVEAVSPDKFAVGDSIRVINSYEIDGGYDLTNGKEYEIISVDSDGDIIVKDDARDEMCITQCEFGAIEKVDAPKAPKAEEPIKPGDFVKITGRIDGWDHDLTRGEVYEVTGLSEPGFYISSDSGLRAYVGGYESDSYEKVDAPAPKKMTRADVKEGDFIEIDFAFDGAYSLRDITKGKAYEIINEGGHLRFVDDVGDSRGAHITEGAFKIVDSPAPKLKVGDYITIDFSLGEDANFNYIDLTDGKAYLVYETERGELAFRDDVNDQRVAQIKQGAYTIVDAPATTPAKAPVAAYKVGDRVSVTSGGYALDENQMRGTVTHAAHDVYAVKLDNYDGMTPLNFYPHEVVSLLVETPPVAPRGFQLGDIVRIDLQREFGGSINRNGDIGEVTELNHGMARVHVQGRGGSGNFELLKELTLLVANENREDK